MGKSNETKDLKAFQQIISVLQPLEVNDQERVLQSVITFLKVNPTDDQNIKKSKPESSPSDFSGIFTTSKHSDITPKEFLLEKQPESDVERVACLAYYLAWYRETQHFKTLDISKINAEAAQPKFSNAAYSVNNSVKQQYLISESKGQKQLSAMGEQFVIALPDRSAAKSAMVKARLRKKKKKK